jgi:hypothetical protein
MKSVVRSLITPGRRFGALAVAAAALSVSCAALADPLATPAMTGPLSGNATPLSVDAGPLGKVYVGGAATGLAMSQSNPVPGDENGTADLSNGQIFLQKTDGKVQFFIEAGAYALPSLGTQYYGLTNASKAADNFFGYVPVAYLKLAPTAEFSVQVGKLPTLIGAEYTFTFQNMNVERGLLWNQEPAVSKGVQLNYAKGPWAISLSLTDGFYSDKYNWLTGSLGYTFSPKDSLTFVGGGNYGTTVKWTAATPLPQNNTEIYNLIWTHTQGPWIITPYLQYTVLPKHPEFGVTGTSSTFGGAVLAKYSFSPMFSLAGRAEYISSTGEVPLLYGTSSKAYSLTLTPTVQVKTFFIRGELSYTKVIDGTDDFLFGGNWSKSDQIRGLVETGVLF